MEKAHVSPDVRKNLKKNTVDLNKQIHSQAITWHSADDYYDFGFYFQIPFSSLSVKVMPQLTGFQQDCQPNSKSNFVTYAHAHTTHTHSAMSNKPKNDNHSKVPFFVCHAMGNFSSWKHQQPTTTCKRKQKKFLHVKYCSYSISITSYSSRRAFFSLSLVT